MTQFFEHGHQKETAFKSQRACVRCETTGETRVKRNTDVSACLLDSQVAPLDLVTSQIAVFAA